MTLTLQGLQLDCQLVQAIRTLHPPGLGRWERYLKRAYLHHLAQGVHVPLPGLVLQTIGGVEAPVGFLTRQLPELLAADVFHWGPYPSDWNWITLPDGTLVQGSPAACLAAYHLAYAQRSRSRAQLAAPA